MAINGAALGSIMTGQFASRALVGIWAPSFCMGISQGIATSFLAMNVVKTVDVGVIATGAGIGKMSGLNPGALTTLLIAQFSARAIIGVRMKDVASGIANAVCMHFLSANMVNTVSAGIAIGTGIGKVSGLIPTTMSSAIKAKLMSQSIRGISMPFVADAIGNAVCTHIMSMAIINVSIVGAPVLVLGAPIPGGGSGTGKVS
jgi:hypothetical protein